MAHVRQVILAPPGYYGLFTDIDGKTYTQPVPCIVIMQDDDDKTERWTEFRFVTRHGELLDPKDQPEFVALRWPDDGMPQGLLEADIDRARAAIRQHREDMDEAIAAAKERRRLAAEQKAANDKLMAEWNEKQRAAREAAGIQTPTLRELVGQR